MPHPQPSPRDARTTDPLIATALALLLLAAYLLTADLRFQSVDELAVFSLARSLTGRGALDVDGLFWTTLYLGEGTVAAPGVDGHLYSLKDPGLSVLITPLLALAYRVGSSPVRTAFLISPLLTALTGALLYLATRDIGFRRGAALLGALTFGLGSMALPYARTLFTQPLAALCLTGATWATYRGFTDRRPWMAFLGGLALGAASTAAIALWVLLPAYALSLIPWEQVRQQRWREALHAALPLLVPFGLGAALFVAGEAAYNTARFGSPFNTGHSETSGLAFEFDTFLVGSVGQLISLPRGVVWYAPFVLLVPFGAAIMWRSHRRLAALLGAQAALVFLLYSSWYDWGGGLAWGPRFLVPLMPLLALFVVPLFERLGEAGGPQAARAAVGLVLLASTGVQIAAALVDATASQTDIFDRLRAITRGGGLAERVAVFTDASALPYPRLVALFEQGEWSVLWMSRGTLDPLLLAALLALVVLAAGGLWLACRGGRHRLLGGGLLVQGALSAGAAALMLARYPQAPNGYNSYDPAVLPGLGDVTAILSEQAAPGDGIILLLQDDYIRWSDLYRSQIPEMNFALEAPLPPESAEMLARAAEWYDRVWLVSRGTLRGDPSNGVEAWLGQRAHIGTVLFDDESISLLTYTFPQAETLAFEPAGVHFGEHIELVEYAWEMVRRPDAAWINLTLHWKALADLPGTYSITTQVWTRDWAQIAQHDGQPGGFYAPTTAWQPGEIIEDRHSIQIPADLLPGPYYLHVGVYDLETGEIVWPVEVPEYLWIPIEIEG